ncbi:hypothetical protein [Candidatus Pantoea multigeneris]|uniref:Uncharacterized protein n=1 Tax=Candidatus Pantoea multigeneris TaxID=2608357 RepID=A0ABX0RI15_9GAMM|nr:hypothetical protein [Pantoea multigeneris]NIF23951.1 hypothetical protein [Pantoea multigeneris]
MVTINLSKGIAQEGTWLLIREVVAELLLSMDSLQTNDILLALYSKSVIADDIFKRNKCREAMCMLYSEKH